DLVMQHDAFPGSFEFSGGQRRLLNPGVTLRRHHRPSVFHPEYLSDVQYHIITIHTGTSLMCYVVLAIVFKDGAVTRALPSPMPDELIGCKDHGNDVVFLVKVYTVEIVKGTLRRVRPTHPHVILRLKPVVRNEKIVFIQFRVIDD